MSDNAGTVQSTADALEEELRQPSPSDLKGAVKDVADAERARARRPAEETRKIPRRRGRPVKERSPIQPAAETPAGASATGAPGSPLPMTLFPVPDVSAAAKDLIALLAEFTGAVDMIPDTSPMERRALECSKVFGMAVLAKWLPPDFKYFEEIGFAASIGVFILLRYQRAKQTRPAAGQARVRQDETRGAAVAQDGTGNPSGTALPGTSM